MAQKHHPAGSDWKKCDLHVHTLASYDYKDSGKHYQDIADYINKSDLDIVAITDHWTVDGYYDLKPLVNKDKCLLPGIELRIDKSSKTKVLGGAKGKSSGTGLLHAIVLFPEDTSLKDIERNFLHQIELCEEKKAWITREEIIKKGKELGKPGLTDDEYFKVGCQQAYVDYKQVVDATKTLNGIVCLTYDSYGGFDNIDPINDSAFKANLVKDCDLIETHNDEVRKAYYEHPGILKACGKKIPCFKGSDAHSIKDIGRNYIWIKANASFEGLRQILYFPKERVSFDEKRPTYPFPWIKSIKFENLKAGHPLSVFTEEIVFNNNLTSIIGQPSIGKSTLSEIIAYVFDKHSEVQSGEETSKIENISVINKNLNVKIEVKRGTVSNTIERNLKGEWGGDMSADEFDITYLNQGYIDRIARKPDAVSQLVNEKMDTSELEVIESDINTLRTEVKNARSLYLKRFKLEQEKAELDKKLSVVKKFFDISGSTEYKTLNARRIELVQREKDIKSLEEKLTQLVNLITDFKDGISNLGLGDVKISNLLPSLSKIKIPTEVDLADKPIEAISSIIEQIKNAKEIEEIRKEKQKLVDEIKSLFIKENISLTQGILKQKQEEQAQIELLLNRKQQEIDRSIRAKSLYQEKLTALRQQEKSWEKQNELCLEHFNKGLKDISVRYDLPDIEAWLINVLTEEVKTAWETYTDDSQKELKKFKKPSQEDIVNLISQIKDKKKVDIEGVIGYLLESLKNHVLPLNLENEYIKWLFGDYCEVITDFLKMRLKEFSERGQHQIYIGEKNISKEGLSYTERCGALLEVLLEKGENPIIMDQPEENLGSTYVTQKLKNKVLEKKFQRQIIIVSHNPNTVVLADSDLIHAIDRKTNSADAIEITSGGIEKPGIKDCICNIIEGGEEAFDQRVKAYKHLA